jgi:hypothetical protein
MLLPDVSHYLADFVIGKVRRALSNLPAQIFIRKASQGPSEILSKLICNFEIGGGSI